LIQCRRLVGLSLTQEKQNGNDKAKFSSGSKGSQLHGL
jgi:hypothetical protein